jgi:hypothetical protein
VSQAGRFLRSAAAVDDAAAVFEDAFSFLATVAAIGVDLPVDLVRPTRLDAGCASTFTDGFRFSVVVADDFAGTEAAVFGGSISVVGCVCFRGFFTVLGARSRLDMYRIVAFEVETRLG